MDKNEIIAALKPFAEALDAIERRWTDITEADDMQPTNAMSAEFNFRIGELRRARRVLAALDPANERTDLDTHLVRLFAEQSSTPPASAPEPSEEADNAIARIAQSLGGPDEWADQRAMIADAERRARELLAALDAAERERDAWRERESETQEALQKIGDEFGVYGGEPRVDGVRRVLTEQRAALVAEREKVVAKEQERADLWRRNRELLSAKNVSDAVAETMRIERAALSSTPPASAPEPSERAREIVATIRSTFGVSYGPTKVGKLRLSDFQAAVLITDALTAARAEGRREGLREAAKAVNSLYVDTRNSIFCADTLDAAEAAIRALADQEPKP